VNCKSKKKQTGWEFLEPLKPKKQYTKALLFAILSLIIFFNSQAALAKEPNITADAAVLMDAGTGQIYFEKNAHKKRSPASLTKIMTGLLAIEMGNPRDVVTVGRRAAGVYIGSTIGLRYKDRLTLDDLTKAALICSANDSTVAIAEHVAGDHDRFVDLMNTKAFVLGAFNTNYVNTNGYTAPNHYSTAYDLAVITRYALQNPRFAELVCTKETTIKWLNRDREEIIHNTNKMLTTDYYHYEGINGVKTGSTIRAGNCLVASATRDGRRLIAVVLHCRNRYVDAAALLDYGFNECLPRVLVKKGEKVGTVSVLNGVFREVPAVAGEELEVAIFAEELSHIERHVYLRGDLLAPVEKGVTVGRMTLILKGRILGEVELVAGDAVPRDNLFNRLRYKLKNS